MPLTWFTALFYIYLMPMPTRLLLLTMALLQVSWLLLRLWQLPADAGRKEALVIIYTVILAVLISSIPKSLLAQFRRRLQEYFVNKNSLLLSLICIIAFIVGTIYATYQVVHADEAAIYRASSLVAQDGVNAFFANYLEIEWLGSQHPPLIPLVYGLIMHTLELRFTGVRLISLICGIMTLVTTYYLGRELYDHVTGIIATLLFVSFGFFFNMGAAVMSDMPVTLLFSLVLLLTIYLCRSPTYRLSITIGIIIGAGLLSKYTMLLVYPATLGYVLIHKSLKRLKVHLGIVILVSLGLVTVWLIYANHIGIFETQRDTLSSYITDVTGTSYWETRLLYVLLHRLPSALGVYNFPLLLLSGLYLLRYHGRSDLFLLLWIAVVIVPVLFTLPSARYLMPGFPALALVMARGLRTVSEFPEQAIILALLYCGSMLYLFTDITL